MLTRILITLLSLIVSAVAADDTFTPSAKPLYDLTLLGTEIGTDVMVSGQNPLTQQEGTSGWFKLRGRNLTSGEAGLYLSSLEGGFDGELVAKLDRSEVLSSGTLQGLMVRYSLSGESDYSALLWRKNGEVVYRKKMGAEFVDEVVVSVRADVQKIWVRMRADDHSISFGVAKEFPDQQESVPKVWMEVGDRFAVSDFFYSGFVLLPAPGSTALEGAKFSNIGIQPVGGVQEEGVNPPIAGRRGFFGRMARRIGNLGSEMASAIGDAYDWTVDVGGDALGVAYRVVVKRIVVPVVIYVFDNTVGELIRVYNRGFGTHLPPYESIDEGFHSARILADFKANKVRPNDPLYDILYAQLGNVSSAGAELPVNGAMGEWEKVGNSLKNLKLYMADYLAAEIDGSSPRFAPANYQLYTGFEMEKLFTRTTNMLQYCYDAKSPDIFDVFIVPWVNDAYDCTKATNRFSNSAEDFTKEYGPEDNRKSLKSERDGVLQDAAEYLLLMGMFANLSKDFEEKWRPQRNDLFGKVKWYIDAVGDPGYGNSNIPVKVYAGLAMNRVSRGPNDYIFQRFNSMIEDLIDDEGGFAEGTDYLSWTLQEALPVYYWGIANGWITQRDVPEKVRKSAEWILNSADPSGFVPRVDDASMAQPVGVLHNYIGLNYWLAPFSLVNKDGRYMDYTSEVEQRFPGAVSLGGAANFNVNAPGVSDGQSLLRFLTYPIGVQGPEKWSPYMGAHVQGGIGKVKFDDASGRVGVTLLAENGILLERANSHDQQDNSSFTLSRWEKSSLDIDHLVLDPGYAGYSGRRDLPQTHYLHHNTPFVMQGSDIGGVDANGVLSVQAGYDRAQAVFPSLNDYLCVTSLWNTVFLGTGNWMLGEVVQGIMTPNPYMVGVNLLTLPLISVPFACGVFDLPNIYNARVEAYAGGGPAQFQNKYSTGLMSMQSYDVGGSSSRAVIQQDKDVLVFDFFYRDGVPADRQYGVSYNLPEVGNIQSGNGGWAIKKGSSAATLKLFPGTNSGVTVLQDGAITYTGKASATLSAYRVSQAYQPSGNASVFPHLSTFQVGPANTTFQSYTTKSNCSGTDICVERTERNLHRVVFVRAGYPSQSGQVNILLQNGQMFQSDAGFGILEEDLSNGTASAIKLYHLASASLGSQNLFSGLASIPEWPIPSVSAVGPRRFAVNVGTGVGTFAARALHVDPTEVVQGDYNLVMGQNPSSRKDESLPVTNLTWYDALVYANLRSQREGLTPCYSWTSSTKDPVGRVVSMENLAWDQNATGFRLPTLEEWQALAGAVPTSTDQAWVFENAGAWVKTATLGVSDSRGLMNLWGNVEEWTWSDATTAIAVGGSVSTSLATLGSAPVAFDKSQTSSLRGFRLVRSEAVLPPFFQFADTTRPWTIGGTAVPSAPTGSQGGTALQMAAGYQSIDGPVFRTSELSVVGDKLLFDVFQPATVPNPYWLGDVQVFVSIPSAGVYMGHLGVVPLSGKPLGQWSTVEFAVNPTLLELLKGDYRDVRFKLVVNTASGTNGLLVQNLRFGGTLWTRPVAVAEDPSQSTRQDLDLLGFESLSGWSSTAPLNQNLAARTQGGASLQLTGNGWMPVVSQPFASKALVVPGVNKIAVDLYIPRPQPNPWWTGALQIVLESNEANLHGVTLETIDLTPFAQGQFHRIAFNLPASIQQTLSAGVPDLRVTLNLNTSSQAGPFLFDNLRGEP